MNTLKEKDQQLLPTGGSCTNKFKKNHLLRSLDVLEKKTTFEPDLRTLKNKVTFARIAYEYSTTGNANADYKMRSLEELAEAQD